MSDYLSNKLNNIISGYKINEDDAAWLRALLPEEKKRCIEDGMFSCTNCDILCEGPE